MLQTQIIKKTSHLDNHSPRLTKNKKKKIKEPDSLVSQDRVQIWQKFPHLKLDDRIGSHPPSSVLGLTKVGKLICAKDR